MAALICGSLAYDTVMVYPGRFRDHILADRIHMLNVSFMVPTLRRYFGGCAGNIAYNLRLLGAEGHAMGAVGHDFRPYQEWLDLNGMSSRYVRVIEDEYTAQAYITTDLDDNQITAFHPGAMNHSHLLGVPAGAGISIGILAPDGREGMVVHAAQFVRAGIPFVFDPGQALPLFGGQELEAFIDQAAWVTVNDYEAQLLQERTGLSTSALASRVKAYIVTRGAEGAVVALAAGSAIAGRLYARGPYPVGSGDAFLGGLVTAVERGDGWESALATALGAATANAEIPGAGRLDPARAKDLAARAEVHVA